jgi:hypothetical protein
MMMMPLQTPFEHVTLGAPGASWSYSKKTNQDCVGLELD